MFLYLKAQRTCVSVSKENTLREGPKIPCSSTHVLCVHIYMKILNNFSTLAHLTIKGPHPLPKFHFVIWDSAIYNANKGFLGDCIVIHSKLVNVGWGD